MRPKHAPVVASWLLNTLAPRNEALAGDLLEELQRRGSRLWYWRQVLVAIAVGSGRTIRSHKLLTLRALVVAWSIPNLYYWLLGLHPVGLCVSCVVAGWCVARFHRPFHGAMVSAVLASFIASNLGGFAWLVYTNSQRYLFSSHPEAVGLFAASLAPPIAGYALITTGMLVGGLLGSPRRELATPR